MQNIGNGVSNSTLWVCEAIQSCVQTDCSTAEKVINVFGKTKEEILEAFNNGFFCSSIDENTCAYHLNDVVNQVKSAFSVSVTDSCPGRTPAGFEEFLAEANGNISNCLSGGCSIIEDVKEVFGTIANETSVLFQNTSCSSEDLLKDLEETKQQFLEALNSAEIQDSDLVKESVWTASHTVGTVALVALGIVGVGLARACFKKPTEGKV